MKGFKKLLLTSAILAASSSALAMQAMDDETMSATTGQDGLAITIDSSVVTDMNIKWIDRTGIAGGTFTNPGAVVIDNLGMTITNLDIEIDAGSSAANNGQLNIAISTADNIVVNLNDGTNGAVIGVTSAGAAGSATGTVTPILSFSNTSALTISGGLDATLKLGNRAAGEDFLLIDFANPLNVSLTGLSILDAVGTAANGAAGDVGIGVGTLSIANLDVVASVNVVGAGLQIDTTGTTIGEVGLERVVLGDLDNASIGDVYISGLTVDSVITVAGKL